MKSEQKCAQGAVTVLMSIIALAPLGAAWAASSSYGFTMSMVTDGCLNQQFHPLNVGVGKLVGSTSTQSPNNLAIRYNLQREIIGLNPSYGTVQANPNSSFSMQFPKAINVSSTKYCLYIDRVRDDGFTVSGSGTLKN